MREIVPIAELTRRMPEQGRIRLGKKVTSRKKDGSTYDRPTSIDTFRFTSHDRDAIMVLAEKYGGTPESWKDSPRAGEWQVATDCNALPVVLPPDPLGGTPVYELWSKGGCQRRCNGVQCMVAQPTDDSAEMVPVDCLCVKAGALACKPKLRLSVVLRDVSFGGTWRCETSGWNAMQEIPGMVQMIQAQEARGALTRAVLGLRAETSVVGGQTKKFVVPYLAVEETLEELAAGQSDVRSLGQGTIAQAPQLEAGRAEVAEDEMAPFGSTEYEKVKALLMEADDPFPQQILTDHYKGDLDNDIIDAEIVEETDPPATGKPKYLSLIIACNEVADLIGVEPDLLRHALVKRITKARTTSSKDLTPEEAGTFETVVEDLRGRRVFWWGEREGQAVLRTSKPASEGADA